MPPMHALEGLSSYDISRRTLAASRSSGTNSISPGTSVRSPSPSTATRARPLLLLRCTYEGRSKEQIKISAEGRSARQAGSADELNALDDHDSRPRKNIGSKDFVDASEAATLRFEKSVGNPLKPSQSASSRPGADSISSTAGPGKKTRPDWARSQSGSIWIQKHRAALDSGSTTSARSTTDRSEASAPGGISIMPLIPPTPPSRPEPVASRDSGVRIEIPFPRAQDTASLTSRHSLRGSTNRLPRRVSLNALHLLSAPMTALRKFVTEKPSEPNTPPIEHRQTSLPTIDAQGHKSTLKRYQTALVLEHVSSLLESSKGFGVKSRFRAWTAKSVSTTSSSDPNEPRPEQQHKGIAATFNIFKEKSFDDVHATKTVSSSILNMQMGSTPQNSPQEIATYKIKRSSSAETEEFFKIDISIRGGTSYLPSEARRIHTPPLPDDDDIGVYKRGFFFDYNLPHSNTGTGAYQSRHSQQNTPALKPSIPPSSTDKLGSGYTLKPPTPCAPSKLTLSSSQRTNTHIVKVKTGDWYETQLADLDATIPDIELGLSHQMSHSSSEKTRNEHQVRLIEVKRQQYMDQMDWNIPEHLPSSPLCPRHPRY
ncbi:hypothetical protein H2198_006003 [Neophaeococcomyces mojaviensis]|uniref:Uncharacterized protein n=1 Tax=Neophaeococcomyces mojaviensis TaxID=3383035 RepID=A0ACC3A430_9EURO|nr:hypothetical protein H2198_006003 [Knufia sp. JES_112]